MALTDNLVSYWKLDESSGNAADSVGSNTLTNVNTATYAAGKINNGVNLELDSSQYLSVADASQTGLNLADSISISLWVNFESIRTVTNEANTFVAKGNIDGLTQAGYIFWISKTATDSKLFFWYRDSVNNAVNFNATWAPSTATWYHVVAVFDDVAHTGTFYVNGSQQGSTTSSLANNIGPEGSQPFMIGNHSAAGTDKLFDGLMDEVGIWSRVLTSTEVTSLYNGGAGFAYPFSGGGATTNSNFFMFMDRR